MTKPRIMTDFHGLDAQNRVSLTCIGAMEDLMENGVTLYEGLELTLTYEDIEADGVVEWSDERSWWMAKINPDEIRNVGDSDERT